MKEKTVSQIDQIKRKVYLYALSIGTLIIPTMYWLFSNDGTLTSFDKIFFPVLFVLVITSFVTFIMIGKRSLAAHEIFWFAVVFVVFLSQFTFLLKNMSDGLVNDMGDYVMWISILYLLAYIMFPSRLALFWSIAFLGAILIIGVYFGFLDWETAGFSRELSILIQIYVSSSIYIVLLNAYAILKNQYLRAEMRVDIMASIANKDTLTGVYSRAKLRDLLEQHFDAFETFGKSFSVVMMDLDNLKKVNDTYGHAKGDYLLQQIVKIMQRKLRENDILGRWGGDEFLLICPDTDQIQAKLISKRLMNTVANTEIAGIGKVTISSGEATCSSGDNMGLLLNRADQNMYLIKQTNKSFNPEKKKEPHTFSQLESTDIDICPATSETYLIAAELIYETFVDTATHLFGLGSSEKAKEVIAELFRHENTRFSYKFADLLYQNGELTGLLLSYPGSQISALVWPTFKQITKTYSLLDFGKFLSRSLQVINVKEAEKDEYFINNIAVLPEYRGQGYGKLLLEHAESRAHQHGIKKVSLVVDVNNLRAIGIYEWVGYSALEGSGEQVNNEKAGWQMVTQKMVKNLF